MKLPPQDKPVARRHTRDQVMDALTPSGCCAQMCVPFVGCHCVAESPLCPG